MPSRSRPLADPSPRKRKKQKTSSTSTEPRSTKPPLTPEEQRERQQHRKLLKRLDNVPAKRSWHGYIDDIDDALLVVEGVLRGRLSLCPRRLLGGEPDALVRSGSVFVYDSETAGIHRWTDNVLWSPSRVAGMFLIYREMAVPWSPREKKRANKKPETPDGVSSEEVSDETLIASQWNIYGTDITDKDILKAGFASRIEALRSMVASLANSYQFLPLGLVKKTYNVPYLGKTYRVVSYYSCRDVILSKLKRPSVDPRLATLVPRLELFSSVKAPDGSCKLPKSRAANVAQIEGLRSQKPPEPVERPPALTEPSQCPVRAQIPGIGPVDLFCGFFDSYDLGAPSATAGSDGYHYNPLPSDSTLDFTAAMPVPGPQIALPQHQHFPPPAFSPPSNHQLFPTPTSGTPPSPMAGDLMTASTSYFPVASEPFPAATSGVFDPALMETTASFDLGLAFGAGLTATSGSFDPVAMTASAVSLDPAFTFGTDPTAATSSLDFDFSLTPTTPSFDLDFGLTPTTPSFDLDFGLMPSTPPFDLDFSLTPNTPSFDLDFSPRATIPSSDFDSMTVTPTSPPTTPGPMFVNTPAPSKPDTMSTPVESAAEQPGAVDIDFFYVKGLGPDD